MDPIEVIDLCRHAAKNGMPKDVFVPRVFTVGEYQQLWRSEPKLVRKLLDELMCSEHVSDGLELLLRFDVLYSLFPEISAMKSLGDGEGRHKDVWSHTLAVVSGVKPELDLRWGALLHDIGKVRTRRVTKGKVTFHNHDAVGARLVDSLQNRTNLFENDEALLRTVRYLVLEHLRPAGYNADWTDSAVRRLITECGDKRFFEKLMALSRADMTTKNDKKRASAMARSAELEKRVAEVVALDNAPKLPKGTMGMILERSGKKPGAWLNEIRDVIELNMKNGLLPIDKDAEFYVKIGLVKVDT
jgi:poly(A) polymerase